MVPGSGAGAGTGTVSTGTTATATQAFEFRVNSTTALSQARPDAARLGDGGYVVVWSTRSLPPSPGGFDDARNGIYAQRYSAAGTRVGGEVRVNDYVAGRYPAEPHVTALADGGYLVAWYVIQQDGFQAVQMQRIRPDGSRGAFRQMPYSFIPTYSIAGLRDGGYVLLLGLVESMPGYRLNLQHYGSDDMPIGAALQVGTTNAVGVARIAALLDGSLLAAWAAPMLDGLDASSHTDIYTQRFNLDATPRGSVARITTVGAGQGSPVIAGMQGGGYVLAWNSDEGSSQFVMIEQFRPDGSPVATPARVDGEATIAARSCPEPISPVILAPRCGPVPLQGVQSLTGLDGGGYVVVWSTPDRPGTLYARRYDPHVSVSPVMRATSDASFTQRAPAVVVSLLGGGFAMAWETWDEDGDMGGIYARQWGSTGLQ